MWMERVTRRRRWRAVAVWLAYPLLIALVAVVLGGLKLSGSSVALYTLPGESNGLLVGRARDLRTDEWFVRTPLVARAAELGLPEKDLMGVGTHDMAVGNDVPTGGWAVLARPTTLPYHVFGVERAFALEWWIVYLALPAIALYTLSLVLGVRALTAALVATIVVLSPAVQWWTVTITGTTIGYACFAAAAFIAAMRARFVLAGVGLAVLAGWMAACLVLVLYPPWAVPMLIFGVVASAAAIGRSYPPSHHDRRRWWFRLLLVSGGAAAAGGMVLLAFAQAHRDALQAIADAVYPGQRRLEGGTGDLATLFGAPFDLIGSTRSSAVVAVNGFNQSEAAAGLFTVFAIAVVMVADRSRSTGKHWRIRLPLLAILGASAVFLAWYLLPIPAGIGRVLLLDRVRPDRLLLPLAVVSAVALGLFVDALRAHQRRLPPLPLLAGCTAFAVPTLWAGWGLEVDGHSAPRWQVLLLAAAATVGIGLSLYGWRVGLWLIVALFAISAATVNPLQRGLGELVDSPAAQLGRELRARRDTGVVMEVFANPSGDLTALGGLTASGVPLITGMNGYPNTSAWRVLDPSGSSRHAWDRYANAIWAAGPPGSQPKIQLFPPAALTVVVDPCDPRLAKLGVQTVVSDQELNRPCLTEIKRTMRGPTLFAYRIDRTRV